MNPSFRCPACGFRFRVDRKYFGRRVRCPSAKCGQPILLSSETVLPESAVILPESRVPAQSRRRSENAQNQPRNPVLLLVAGFVVTILFGGAAVAGYWIWTNPAARAIARTVDDSAATAITPKSEIQVLKSDESAPRLTSVVSGESLREHARRQQLLEDKVLPFLKTHCSDCHNADEQEGDISLHQLTTVDQLLQERKKWERVYRMINAGAMPPADHEPRPEEGARQEVAEILYEELFNFDCTQIHHAGRSTLHRLNRAEYNNTIRDLFGLSITPADKFPHDDVGEGFDNIGDVLSVPPLLMEKYLDAAETVAAAVIDTRDFSKGLTLRFTAERFKSSLGGEATDDDALVLTTNGSATIDTEEIRDGKYRIRIEAEATQGGDEVAKMAMLVDGQRVGEFEVPGHRKSAWFEHELTMTGGRHVVGAEFLNDFYDEKAENRRRRDRNLGVRTIEISGPEGGGEPAWHVTHRRFVTTRPSDTVSVKDAAATVLRPILYRAFRRPVTDVEVSRFAELVDEAVTEYKESYESGLSLALQAVLVSTDFLFRREADPEGEATERSLNDYEIASRLSYFLWSSMPDDELLLLAENRRLLDRTILRSQIERMLRDEKALALGANFAAQWLNLRNLAEVRPNPDVYPDFDESLRLAMVTETELLFNTIVREDRSVDDFLSADFTFVNERLAQHYAIQGVNGDEFVRVSLAGSNRSGVLTHASILTLTSNPGRTSPVKRGKWILENILGDAPPPAPPGIPALEEATKDISGLSLRERMESHRKDPGCASCHKTMDPLGMGLENFDAVGRWRDTESDKPVDASGELPSGEKFSGPLELIAIIRGRQDQFCRALTERLMIYSLGRGLEYYDKCAVDQTLLLMKERGNRFSALVEGIVTSDPFLKRSKIREFEITAAE